MRVKPSEIQLVSAMLAEPAEDADSLAEAIIRALDEKRESDDRFYVVTVDGISVYTGTCWVIGPFPTNLQATKARDKHRMPSPGGRAVVGLKGGLNPSGYLPSTPILSPWTASSEDAVA